MRSLHEHCTLGLSQQDTRLGTGGWTHKVKQLEVSMSFEELFLTKVPLGILTGLMGEGWKD